MGQHCSAVALEPLEFVVGASVADSGDRDLRETKAGTENVRDWERRVRQEARQLERDMTALRREEEKLKREMTQAAAKGQNDKVQKLAQSVVRLRKSLARIESTKASMTATRLQLTAQSATMSSTSALKASAAMMTQANQLVDVQQMHRTLGELQAEKAKAEFAEEVMELALDDPDDEADVDAELQKVYEEVILDAAMQLGTTPAASPLSPLPEALPEREDTAQSGTSYRTVPPADTMPLGTQMPFHMTQGSRR